MIKLRAETEAYTSHSRKEFSELSPHHVRFFRSSAVMLNQPRASTLLPTASADQVPCLLSRASTAGEWTEEDARDLEQEAEPEGT